MKAHELARLLLALPDVDVVGAHFDGNAVGEIFEPQERTLIENSETVIALWSDSPYAHVSPKEGD